MLLLFASTLFFSATLLFSVQPMVARMLVPLLGGTPAVWNTCMLFFQAMLLAGYAYAHFTTTRLTLRKQAVVQATLILLAAITLPIYISEANVQSPPTGANPSFWLLKCLAGSVGLPFFIIATSAPLLQKWFSLTRHASAKDPYFLYGASNLGSLIALLGYPTLMEPHLRLLQQSQLWMAGYAFLAILIFCCAASVLRASRSGESSPDDGQRTESVALTSAAPAGVAIRERLRWMLLAFVPSSLMLGVTTYITTDIASIPLLWVIPLAVYLATFILAFSRREIVPVKVMTRVLPIGAIGLIYLILAEATEPPWLLIVLHLVVFFVAAMACHGQLARSRPQTVYLTEFYLWISLGGVLGGIVNALVAPAIFTTVLEYPIVLLLACVLAPIAKQSSDRRSRSLDFVVPLGVGALTLLLVWLVPQFAGWRIQLRLGMIFGLPAAFCYVMVDRSIRFSLSLAAVVLAGLFYSGTHGRVLHAERNFFGVLRVTMDESGTFHHLIHGNTVHGRQSTDPARRCEPLSYYHITGPLGQVFTVFNAKPQNSRVAVVGLGAGSMACYAAAHQTWTFYEINPAVILLAQSTNYFSFLNGCSAARTEMVAGDARLQLRTAPNGAYDLIVLDAFSSDAIPIHLITREALQLYLSKLAVGGMLAFHISNRCLDLEPVLGGLAKDANLICHGNDENDPSPSEHAAGKDQSHWLVMARRREDLGKLAKDSRWWPVLAPKNARIWTDDFSDILGVFKWK